MNGKGGEKGLRLLEQMLQSNTFKRAQKVKTCTGFYVELRIASWQFIALFFLYETQLLSCSHVHMHTLVVNISMPVL